MLIRLYNNAEMHVFVAYSCPFPFELDVVSLVRQFCGVGLPHCALAVALMLPTHAERVLAVEVCGEGWLCVCIYVCVCVCVCVCVGRGGEEVMPGCVCVCVGGGGGGGGSHAWLCVCVGGGGGEAMPGCVCVVCLYYRECLEH